MKVEKQELPKAFTPFSIQITFESPQEVTAFHNIFDLKPICEHLRGYGIQPEGLRQYLDPEPTDGRIYREMFQDMKAEFDKYLCDSLPSETIPLNNK